MAGIPKKVSDAESSMQTSIAAGSLWMAGIYARLSVDSDDQKNESIDTQIEIAKEYIRRAGDIEYVDRYTDLGRSGTDFEREGFARMMEDVRQKKINCIVVKDLSRFGRDHIETGNYIEKIFPFLNVRFIAVTDGYDSECSAGDDMQLTMNLKNIVNELYAKDIAQRVKLARRAEQERGSYIGGAPPYGYCLGKIGDRKVLLPDGDTRDIVVRIFEMYAEGSTRREIAAELYQRKIQRPSVYYATKEVCCPEDGSLQQWSYDTIKGILTNQVYIGMLQGHGDRAAMERTHEPLISEDLFYKVSRRFERQSRYSNSKGFSKRVPLCEDIFKDKIYCSGCGRRLIRHSSVKLLGSKERVRNYHYACPDREKIESCACKCQGISLRALEGILKSVLEKEFAFSKMRAKDLCRENAREAEQKKAIIRAQKNRCTQRQESLALEASKLYLRYRGGGLSREVFLEKKQGMAEALEMLKKQELDLVDQERSIDQEVEKVGRFIRKLMKWKDDAKLDRQLIGCLVKKIDVYSRHHVEIIFDYRKDDLYDGRGVHGSTV